MNNIKIIFNKIEKVCQNYVRNGNKIHSKGLGPANNLQYIWDGYSMYNITKSPGLSYLLDPLDLYLLSHKTSKANYFRTVLIEHTGITDTESFCNAFTTGWSDTVCEPFGDPVKQEIYNLTHQLFLKYTSGKLKNCQLCYLN